jgi:hypothetical protein
MNRAKDTADAGNVIATVCNQRNPGQRVDIVYVRKKNAFVTSGISRHFAEREILIPAYLVVADLALMGAIVSSILEKLSVAAENETIFRYEPDFEVLEKTFSLRVEGEYVRLETAQFAA